MGGDVEHLVRDRFAEFQRAAQSRNTLTLGAAQQATTPSASSKAAVVDATNAKSGKATFMREFFESINVITTSLNRGRDNVKTMGGLLEEALMATTQDREKDVLGRLQGLVEDTNHHILGVKSGLEELKVRSDEAEKKQPNSAEGKIRRNMQQAMAKKHQQLLQDFQKAQVDFKRALESRQEKEMQLLMPDTTEEERAEMIAEGETTSLIVARKMAGSHAMILDEVERIREKHQDILRLERSIADLAQMFQEMAVLVESQGEMLDAIEVHVHKTKGYTAKAEQQLITTRKTQHNTQKWMCCLTFVLLIVILAILGPVLIKD